MSEEGIYSGLNKAGKEGRFCEVQSLNGFTK
jgi:hypothetical protein